MCIRDRFYAGQVVEKHKTTGNTRLMLVDIIDPKTGKTKNGHKNLSVLELMPNNVDKPWVYAYITFDNLNKLLNISTPLKHSTSTPSLFPTQQSLNTKTKKRKAHPLSKNPEELVFPPDVFNDDEDDNTSNEMPIIDEEPSPISSKNGGKRKTKKRKPKKRKTLKKRKTTKKR